MSSCLITPLCPPSNGMGHEVRCVSPQRQALWGKREADYKQPVETQFFTPDLGP